MPDLNKIIIESLKEIGQENKIDTYDHDTPLYNGVDGLDSLGLVTLLINIEQKIEDLYDINITIADEKAMSQKNSPFKSIGSLSKYLENILKKND